MNHYPILNGLRRAAVVLPLLFLAGNPALAAGATPHKAAALGSGVAFAPDGRLWWTGLDEQGRLFVRDSADEGRSWSAPRLLAADERISADGENRPKIAFGPAGVAVISYTQPLAKPYTGAIRMLRSTDGGAHFGAPFTVHADRQPITHRFESIGFDASGALHVLWIDKRGLEANPGGGYRGAAVYRNVSADGGAHFGPDTKLADHTCECCRIALAPSPDGGLAAMWRHVFAQSERDHGFARLGQPAAAEPVRATQDHWSINACPHHGPGLAPAASGGYHAVWFGQRDGQMRVRYGRLSADGQPFGQVLPLPDEAAEHADVITAGPRVAIVWRSFDGVQTRLRAWLSADDGRHLVLKDLAATPLDNDHPRLARRGEQLFAFWRTLEGAQVHALVP